MKSIPRSNKRMASKGQPEPPVGGIPPQRSAAWFRVVMRVLMFPVMFLDLLAQSVIQKLAPPPYRIKGGCLQRGNCCHYILMEWDPIMDRWPWIGGFWMWWYTQIHGFYVHSFDMEDIDGSVARVMGCRHLQRDGRCGSYRLRPAICRQWPRIEYTSKPYLLKGCGYKAVPRSAQAHDLERKIRDEALQRVRENLGLASEKNEQTVVAQEMKKLTDLSALQDSGRKKQTVVAQEESSESVLSNGKKE